MRGKGAGATVTRSAGRRPFIWIVNGRRLLAVVLAGVFLLFLAWLPFGVDRWNRARHGVAAGVTLSGYPVGGWWENEVRELVLELAEDWRIDPVDAVLTGTGTVVEARPGQRVDVEATVQAVLQARAGQEVSPVLVSVEPAITGAHFSPIYRGDPTRPVVSLAINVDWGADVLRGLLKTLEELQVRATFFVTGRFARRFPELVRAMANAGHELGTHGAEHVHPGVLGDKELDSLILEGAKILHSIAGVEVNLFAPPYGEVNERIARRAALNGFRTIMWTVDTVDWMKKTAAEIQGRVLERVENGAIILMHPMPETVKALPPLVAELRRRGYALLPVGEII